MMVEGYLALSIHQWSHAFVKKVTNSLFVRTSFSIKFVSNWGKLNNEILIYELYRQLLDLIEYILWEIYWTAFHRNKVISLTSLILKKSFSKNSRMKSYKNCSSKLFIYVCVKLLLIIRKDIEFIDIK